MSEKYWIFDAANFIFQHLEKCVRLYDVFRKFWVLRTLQMTHKASNDGGNAIFDKTYLMDRLIYSGIWEGGGGGSYLHIKFEFNCYKIP